jgi:hypothetical protein
MYPGNGAAKCADKPACIMAQTGEAKTFGARAKNALGSASLDVNRCRCVRR